MSRWTGFINEHNPEDTTLSDLLEEAYQKGIRACAEVVAFDIAHCSNCPLGCESHTFGDCEDALVKYVNDMNGKC